MLKKITDRTFDGRRGDFAIVASRYNARFVDSMVRGARAVFRAAGIGRVEIARVPGAFEIPLAVSLLARRRWPRPAAILALGVILRGETAHADQIGLGVSRALMEIQLATEVPVIHEVLLLETVEQARVRCLDSRYNRGVEAARTALEMAEVARRLTAGGAKRVNRIGGGASKER